MSFPTMTPVPSTEDPANFAAYMDAFLAKFPTWATEATRLAVAMTLNATTANSTTSLTIGTGEQSLTVDVSKSYEPGMSVKIAYTTDPTNWMFGDVKTYNSTTGALVVTVISILGSGTQAVWTVSLSGPAMSGGAVTEMPVGGGATLGPVWTEATGTGAPVRAGAPTLTGQATIPTINLTGGQIAFPSTAVPSADANTLDDYEEGTWMPTFISASCTFTYTTQDGWYRKIGDLVHAQFFVFASAANTVTNALTLGSLPFTASNAAHSHGAASIGFSTFSVYPSLNGMPNSVTITIYQQGTITPLTPTTSGMHGGSKYLQGIFTYHI